MTSRTWSARTRWSRCGPGRPSSSAGAIGCRRRGGGPATRHAVSAPPLGPRRPWKAEQLGGGYRLSSWAERTAYLAASAVVAVSQGMARDIQAAYPEVSDDRLHVIYNGIDADFYHYEAQTDVVEALGVDLSRPYVTFVGRITRQKGVPHLLRAAQAFDRDVQILLLAGAADTPELKAETDALVET